MITSWKLLVLCYQVRWTLEFTSPPSCASRFWTVPFQRGRIRSEQLQSRWKSQRRCYSSPSCSIWREQAQKYLPPNKMQACGKGFSSEPWKLLILAGATDVQLYFAFIEKKNYIESRDQKWFVTTCLEKRCLKLWKACMEFSFCTQMQKPVKQTLWLQETQLLCSKEQCNRAEALERHLLLA